MKKIAKILFSVTFSIFILLIGAGVNIVKCNHSGKYKISSAFFTVDKNFSCTPSHGCMETEFVQYIPCVNPDYQAFDDHGSDRKEGHAEGSGDEVILPEQKKQEQIRRDKDAKMIILLTISIIQSLRQ